MGGVVGTLTGHRLDHVNDRNLLDDAVVAHTEFVRNRDVVSRILSVGLMGFGIVAVDLCPDIWLFHHLSCRTFV